MMRLSVPVLGAVALAVLLMVAGCQDQSLDGVYRSLDPDASASLVLKPSGKGVWSTPDEDAPFTWQRHGDEIWMHTKSGGVLAGKITPPDTIVVDLPGVGEIRFLRNQ